MAEVEELALRQQLAEMERERETLKGILELEAMKKQLLKDVPLGPRAAWGEPELRVGGMTYVPSTVTHAPELSAEDEKRLAALLASDADDDDDDDDDDAHFVSQSPAEMAATLARMEDELAELTLLRDQKDELLLLKAQLAALQASAPQ